MKKLLSVLAAGVVFGGTAAAEDVKVGMLQGFTGPTESLVAPMAMGGELAIKEISDSGLFLGGKKVVSVRGDSTCIDAAAATAAAERLITSEGVVGIIGATCSGATTAGDGPRFLETRTRPVSQSGYRPRSRRWITSSAWHRLPWPCRWASWGDRLVPKPLRANCSLFAYNEH